MNTSLAEILNLRYQWEDIVSNFKLSDKNGTIDNLKWYIKYGARSNRFRTGFDQSIEIAKEILDKV